MDRSKLSADQRASLRLLLSGRSYADVAAGLGLSDEEVRSRALAGLAALDAEGGDRLAESERERVFEFLLGQVDAEPLAEDSPAGSAYAAALRQTLTSEGLTRPPAVGDGSNDQSAEAPAVPSEQAGPSWTPSSSPPSRKGGAILLAGACVAAVAVVLVATGTFGSSGSDTPTSTAAGTTSKQDGGDVAGTSPSGNAGQSGGWTVRRAYNLKSVDSTQRRGVGAYETKGSNRSLVFAAAGMPQSAIAGIWLLGGPQPVLVGFQKTDSKGQFTAVSSRIPPGADRATSVVITTEQYTPGGAIPSSPGRILLKAPFGL